MLNQKSESAELNALCALIIHQNAAVGAVDLPDFTCCFLHISLLFDCAELAEFLADTAADTLCMVDASLAVLHGDCRAAEL